jgi:hypothetical protein
MLSLVQASARAELQVLFRPFVLSTWPLAPESAAAASLQTPPASPVVEPAPGTPDLAAADSDASSTYSSSSASSSLSPSSSASSSSRRDLFFQG